METALLIIKALSELASAGTAIAQRHASGDITDEQAREEWAGVVSRVQAANAAWESAAQPGDTEG